MAPNMVAISNVLNENHEEQHGDLGLRNLMTSMSSSEMAPTSPENDKKENFKEN